MCGRYFIDDEMWREIKKICRQIDDAKLKVTRADVRPTDLAWVLGCRRFIQKRCTGALHLSIKMVYLSMPEQRLYYLSRLSEIV